MTYFAIEVVGGFAIALSLGVLCWLLARALKVQHRANKQLRLTREMRRAFEDEFQPFPALFPGGPVPAPPRHP
ncbi:hypothetical protein [Variovorax sp. YR216]|uniref:hypothetical protein n=1 Tax=Variovorax sp. YR216 TaxID=1882828 RepID=UPI00089BF266|nr:hypothetical protein [Variovorax sp. YR216]SEB01644.1 hypothetical protein SAMN05444680_105247 [Variovorax sp. YR216]